MNILNELTVKNLKLNKKRTIVTIIGILLSTALICAVSGMITSFQATIIKDAIDTNGNRHLTVEQVHQKDLKYFENNSHVKSMYLIDNVGYAILNGSQNEYKPYLYLKGYTKEAFENKKIKLESGRLPQNDNEIVISKSVISNALVSIKVGDTLNLELGNRKCQSGEVLNQSNPLSSLLLTPDEEKDTCQEYFEKTTTKEYKVVGIMNRPTYSEEDVYAPGYTAITYSEKISTDSIDVSLLFKKSNYYKEFTKALNENKELNYDVNLNSELLRYSGASLSDNSVSMLLAVASVVIGIIILTSIFVIKNSFDISIVEKTKQYGMLSSVGATSTQIKKNVLYEGFILGAIGIPLGILSGIFADFVLVWIINLLGKEFLGGIVFVFKVPILPIILSIILSSLTIFLSTIKTAHKTSKISPIVAIRNNNEIKLTKKKLKNSFLITKLFGIGGDIAYKNLKRSKKKYRTTVISIVVSVAVFISLASFLDYGFKMTGQYYTDYNYNIGLTINNSTESEAKNHFAEISKLEGVTKSSFHRQLNLMFDAKEYYSDDVFFRYYGESKNDFQRDSQIGISILSLGDEEYKRFIKEIGGKKEDYQNKAILLDEWIVYDSSTENYKRINNFDLSKIKSITGIVNDKENLTIEIAKRVDIRPMGLENVFSQGGFLIVSDEFMDSINISGNVEIFLEAEDADKVENNIKSYLSSQDINNYVLNNIDQFARAQRNVIILVSIFLYGFIIVITLIGVTNIFNTLTTNMNLRKKEFAVLKSIGMTKKEFNRMIRLESILYGTKSLLIGIPIGLIGSYLIYKAFASGNDMNFIIPVIPIIISVVAVYLLVTIIMRFSLQKTDKQNIIETIRNDNI